MFGQAAGLIPLREAVREQLLALLVEFGQRPGRELSELADGDLTVQRGQGGPHGQERLAQPLRRGDPLLGLLELRCRSRIGSGPTPVSSRLR